MPFPNRPIQLRSRTACTEDVDATMPMNDYMSMRPGGMPSAH
jgi:hypothetical protein